MHTQHNFCTQQLRYVGITRIVILFGLNLCAESGENSFQEVLKAVLFGGWSIPPTAHDWLLCGSPTRVSMTFILSVGLILSALACISNNVQVWSFYLGGKLEKFVRVGSSGVSAHARRNLSPVVGNYLGTAVRALRT